MIFKSFKIYLIHIASSIPFDRAQNSASVLDFFFLKRHREPPEIDGPLLSLRKMTNFDYIKGAIPEWVMPPRCQDLAIPLAVCCIASVEGGRPLKIISLRWSHIAHSVAKMVCHSTSRLKGP